MQRVLFRDLKRDYRKIGRAGKVFEIRNDLVGKETWNWSGV